MLAAATDVRARLLDIKHRLVVVVRDHAGQRDGRERRSLRLGGRALIRG